MRSNQASADVNVEAQAQAHVDSDRTAIARATCELRYWSARPGSAQLTQRGHTIDGVQFGDPVLLARANGRRQTFRIAGEDEADPASGLIAYVSPLARAVLGRSVGDKTDLKGEEIEIVAITRGNGGS